MRGSTHARRQDYRSSPGLAIVRAVAETRGGSVDFETGTGGTCFELVL